MSHTPKDWKGRPIPPEKYAYYGYNPDGSRMTDEQLAGHSQATKVLSKWNAGGSSTADEQLASHAQAAARVRRKWDADDYRRRGLRPARDRVPLSVKVSPEARDKLKRLATESAVSIAACLEALILAATEPVK